MSVEQVDTVALDCLEKRINSLHRSIFSKTSQGNKKPLEVLEQSKCTLKEVESRHAVVAQLWKKLEKLSEYLQSGFLEQINMNDDELKRTLVIANEENIKNLSNQVKELNNLGDVVNAKCLQGVAENSSKLSPLLQVHFQQQEEALELSSRIDVLLTAYNNIIHTLSKQFIMWNNLITQCELSFEMEREVIE